MSTPALPTVCELKIADLDGSTTVDAADLLLIGPLIDGLATDGCTPCDQSCGDVEADGRVELFDVNKARDIALGDTIPDLCSFAAADVNADDVVTQRDVGIIDAIAKGQAVRECERCTTVCGDFDQDGDVDAMDGQALFQFLETGSGPPTPCQLDAGDVDGDLTLEQEDAQSITDGVMLTCGPSTDTSPG